MVEKEMDEEKDDDLLRRARRLKQEVNPATDLWSGVAKEINTKPKFAKVSLAIAATVVLGFSLFIWQTYTVENAELQMASQNFQDHEYGLMKAELMVGYQEELEKTSPETREIVERNMVTIALAISEINAALKEDPNNYLLQRMLATTYTNELRLLQETQKLSQSVRQRTEI